VGQPDSKIHGQAKRLGDEIYVASEPSATPLLSYAPQSRCKGCNPGSRPWTRRMQMLSQPFSKAFLARGMHRIPALNVPNHTISTDYPHGERRS
jgi:hypothetical protein